MKNFTCEIKVLRKKMFCETYKKIMEKKIDELND